MPMDWSLILENDDDDVDELSKLTDGLMREMMYRDILSRRWITHRRGC